VLALDRVNFDLEDGEIHVLFGENGAGKSTLINVIAGTYPLTEGVSSLTVRNFGICRHITPVLSASARFFRNSR